MNEKQIYKRCEKLAEYVTEYLDENEPNGRIEVPIRLINEALTGYEEAIAKLNYYEFNKNIPL